MVHSTPSAKRIRSTPLPSAASASIIVRLSPVEDSNVMTTDSLPRKRRVIEASSDVKSTIWIKSSLAAEVALS